jgi:hypothetical protein
MEPLIYPKDYFSEGFFTKLGSVVDDNLTLYCEQQNVSKQEVIDHALREFFEQRGVKVPLPSES